MRHAASLAVVLAAVSLPAYAATSCRSGVRAASAGDVAGTQAFLGAVLLALQTEDMKAMANGAPPMLAGATDAGMSSAAGFVFSECWRDRAKTVEQATADIYVLLRLFWLGAPRRPDADRSK